MKWNGKVREIYKKINALSSAALIAYIPDINYVAKVVLHNN
jgi:hypothetical protein